MTKVLVCSEFSQIGSGYAIHTNELLKALTGAGIECAELASYCRPEDDRINNCRWRVYPVMPNANDARGDELYNAHPGNVFGKHIFERVLLDYRPTHVVDVRDIWNLAHLFTSPFRDFYSLLVMPAVDSNQNKIWLDMYGQADGILTYSEWARELLEGYGIKNQFGTVQPIPAEAFRPLKNKEEIKKNLNLGDIDIIGFVARNQPRKLFPHLMKAFRRYLDETGKNNTYLYLHTTYPDIWDLDSLLLEYNVGHKVLFTYQCFNCGVVESSFFKGPFTRCPRCSDYRSLRLLNTMNPISQEVLNQIYNLFDLYIQYTVCEGYGIPVIEAVAAGIPTMVVNYSAMESFVKEVNSIPIKVKDFHIEAESTRKFAIPDEDDAVEKLKQFFETDKQERNRQAAITRLSYQINNSESVLQKWCNAINNTRAKLPWDAPRREFNSPKDYPRNYSPQMFARWLITDVLQDPSYIGSYMEARLVRDLTNGASPIGHDGLYYFEAMNIHNQKYQPFTEEIAFNLFKERMLNEKITSEAYR